MVLGSCWRLIFFFFFFFWNLFEICFLICIWCSEYHHKISYWTVYNVTEYTPPFFARIIDIFEQFLAIELIEVERGDAFNREQQFMQLIENQVFVGCARKSIRSFKTGIPENTSISNCKIFKRNFFAFHRFPIENIHALVPSFWIASGLLEDFELQFILQDFVSIIKFHLINAVVDETFLDSFHYFLFAPLLVIGWECFVETHVGCSSFISDLIEQIHCIFCEWRFATK